MGNQPLSINNYTYNTYSHQNTNDTGAIVKCPRFKFGLSLDDKKDKVSTILGVCLCALGLLTVLTVGGCLIAAGYGAPVIVAFILFTSFKTAMLSGGVVLIASTLLTIMGSILLLKNNKPSFFSNRNNNKKAEADCAPNNSTRLLLKRFSRLIK